jgi:hypothetical protein
MILILLTLQIHMDEYFERFNLHFYALKALTWIMCLLVYSPSLFLPIENLYCIDVLIIFNDRISFISSNNKNKQEGP